MRENTSLGKLGTLASRPVRRILVATSLTPQDEDLLGAAIALASATAASLSVVHAVEPADADWLVGIGALPTDDARARLAADVARLVAGRVRASVEVMAGPAHRVIAEAAANISPDLIVVGSAIRRGIFLGSTAERVVRRATVPVLVVRGPLAVPPRRVVAPVDLSGLSAWGFRHGLSMASRLAGGNEIRVVALFAIGPLDPTAEEMRKRHETLDDMTRRATRRLADYASEHLPDAPFVLEDRVVLAPARDAILDAAKVDHADLIVMSTHGHGGLDRLVLGSVTATVLREAPCSVLVVPPDAAFAEEVAEAVLSQTAP